MLKTICWRLIGPFGLALAVAPILSGCGSGERAAPIETSAPVTVAPTAVTSSAPASNLDVNISEGSLTVSLNGRKVGDYPSSIEIDVTPYVKSGMNTLKIDWAANTRGSAKIEYALAATPDKNQDIASFKLFDPQGKQAGSKTLEFNLPNPDGTLAAAPEEAPEAETAAPPTTSEQTPAETTPSATETQPAATTPAPASGVKAIMSVSANDAPIEISLNGTKIGDYQAYLKTDIGRYLQVGSNKMVVKWSNKTYLSVKIAYFSSVANDYRDISKLTLYASDTRQPGSRTITFTVPES